MVTGVPKPCTATRVSPGFCFSFSASLRMAMNAPRPVASSRPRLPPSAMGLPVMTPGARIPAMASYSPAIQPMMRALV